MGRAATPAALRGKTARSTRSSPRCSCRRQRGGAWIRPSRTGLNGVYGDAVFVELSNGQSQRIDELVLRVNLGLVANLLGIEVVGQTKKPMLRARLMRMAGGVEPVERHKRGAASEN